MKKKRLISLVLSLALLSGFLPGSLSETEERFNAETLTIENIKGNAWLRFIPLGIFDPIRVTESSYEFSDEEYDEITWDGMGDTGEVRVQIEYDFDWLYDNTEISIYRRFPDPDAADVIGMTIVNLLRNTAYQYSMEETEYDELLDEWIEPETRTWYDFISDNNGTFNVEGLPGIDFSEDFSITIRQKADLALGKPASYPVELFFDAPEEECEFCGGEGCPECADIEDPDDLASFGYNVQTSTITGLHRLSFVVNIVVQPFGVGQYLNEYTYPGDRTFLIEEDTYDAFFTDPDDLARLTVRNAATNEIILTRILAPRHETPNGEFNLDDWTYTNCTPGAGYVYADEDMLSAAKWDWYTADENGVVTMKPGARHKDHTPNFRAAGTEEDIVLGTTEFIKATAPSHIVPLPVSRYPLANHMLTYADEKKGDMIDFSNAFSHFENAYTEANGSAGLADYLKKLKFEFGVCSKGDGTAIEKWKGVSVNKDKMAKLAKFTPKTGIQTVYFRVKSKDPQPPFDWLRVTEQPKMEAVRTKDKTKKIGFSYLHKDPSLVLLKNWEQYMEWAEKPEREDDFDWEEIEYDIYEGGPVLDLPDEKMKVFVRIGPAEQQTNLERGLYDVITPSSKRVGLTLQIPKREPKLKPKFDSKTQMRTLTLKGGMEYWTDEDEKIVKVPPKNDLGKPNKLLLDLDQFGDDYLYIRVSATEKKPASEAQVLPDTTAPRLLTVSKRVQVVENGEIIEYDEITLTVKKGMEYFISPSGSNPASTSEWTPATKNTSIAFSKHGSGTGIFVRYSATAAKPASDWQRFTV
ncbi:MAG: hypothetical protein FWH04_04775 [Oscillospiraceae bacterium]|nr:hypothetical protein [Oscillospiraceae bacterium]